MRARFGNVENGALLSHSTVGDCDIPLFFLAQSIKFFMRIPNISVIRLSITVQRLLPVVVIGIELSIIKNRDDIIYFYIDFESE